ncbi:ricin-type beta-trefoil lectin domain protein [Streptomyces sp. NPDC060184]|uniref:RICIN domain-containing protein n=1 Tax=Streptomyces sp. NPDC060184 TaxID=3347064 RepID=UPI00365387A7
MAIGTVDAAETARAGTIGTTPGTYTSYAFAGSPKLTDVTWSTDVLTDPGLTSQVFWSHQFDFDKGNGAYIGLQSNGGSSRTFLFSVWDVSRAVAGSAGSHCQSFDGEGTGQSCRMSLAWTAGHTYTFTVASEGGGWFGATVRDTTAGTSFELGSILTPATAISPRGMVDRTEYFEWNDSRATCYDQPFSAARFGLPTANGGTVTAKVSATSANDNACAPMTRTDSVIGGTVQNLAVGNSVRGRVIGLSGTCLDSRGRVSGGVGDGSGGFGDGSGGFGDGSGGVGDGTTAGLSTCTGNVEQAWVRSADGTLRLRSDYCLAESGTAAASAVVVRDCAGTGTGGTVTDASKLWMYDTTTHALVNKASGLCLDVPGSQSSDGTPLIVYACTGNANQRWTLPAIT